MEEKHSKFIFGTMDFCHSISNFNNYSIANTVQELESMISEQRQLMEKLTDQCKNLTLKLEDTTSKHK